MAEVSIIIAANQNDGFLERSIQSCLNQTFSDYEILIAGRYADRAATNERIRIIEITSIDPAIIWNSGINQCNGRYVQFLKCGSLLHDRKIEAQIRVLKGDESFDMCCCLEEFYKNQPGDSDLLWNHPAQPFHLDRFLWHDPVWTIASPLWRKSSLLRIGPFKENLEDWADIEFHIRALSQKLNYFFAPFVLQYVPESEKKKARITSAEQAELRFQTLVDLYEMMGSQGILNTQRADAIAVSLLQISGSFHRSGDQRGKKVLEKAAEIAKGGLVKLISTMLSGSFTSLIFGGIARVLLRKRLNEMQGSWKRIKRENINLAGTNGMSDTRVIDADHRPLISVIVPTYKRDESLAMTIEDLCQQQVSSDEFEILIVDNACSEQTKETVESISKNYKRAVTYIVEPAPGAHHARHTGARNARGEVLVFLDDDMRIGSGWLMAYKEAFTRHPGLTAAGAAIVPNWERTEDSWIRELIQKGDFFPAFGLLNRGEEFLLSPDGYFFSGNMAISKSVLFQVGGFNPDQLNDIVLGDGETGLHRKLWQRGYHIGFVPGAASRHYIPTSKMSLDYLLKWSKNWGISSSFGEYSNKKFTTFSLFTDVCKQLSWFVPYWLTVKLISGGKLDPASIHRQMNAVCLYERLKFATRLLFNSQDRKFVRHEDWLNHPVLDPNHEN